MNTKILQKCLDELNKEPFKIDKVIGMLETMIEMSEETKLKNYPLIPQDIPTQTWNPVTSIAPKSDEETFTDKYLNGTIGQIN